MINRPRIKKLPEGGGEVSSMHPREQRIANAVLKACWERGFIFGPIMLEPRIK